MSKFEGVVNHTEHPACLFCVVFSLLIGFVFGLVITGFIY